MSATNTQGASSGPPGTVVDIPTTTTEEIIQEVVEGGIAHTEATMLFMKNFEFYGKSLEQWLDEMAILIPDDPTPQQMRFLFVDVARKYQRASNFFTISKSIHDGLHGGGNIKKSDLVKALIDRYSATRTKRPAASMIERMAESYMNSTAHTKIAAKLIMDFWRQRRDTISEIRESLQQIGISIAVDMKNHA